MQGPRSIETKPHFLWTLQPLPSLCWATSDPQHSLLNGLTCTPIYLYPDPDRQTSEQHLSEIRTDIHMVQVKSCTSKLTSYPKALKQLWNYLY